MFFSDHKKLLADFRERRLGATEDDLVQACSAAINVVLAEVNRYDQACPFMLSQRSALAVKALTAEEGRHGVAMLLYFLTGCVREATMDSSEVTRYEQDVIDRFRSPSIAEDPAWDGWYGYYQDLVFNLLPLHKTARQLSEAASRRREVAEAEEHIKSSYSQITAFANDLKGEMREMADREKGLFFSDIHELEERILGYKEELGRHASNFNFVGLSHAFKGLIETKNEELERYAIGVFLAGFLALAVPVCVALLLTDGMLGWTHGQGWSSYAVMKAVGFLGIELLLLYYFRITLKSFLLAKDQKVDLTLRLALCQFIEGYRDFSLATKEKGLDVLSGFEGLIFSPLQAHDKNLPPTVDGVDGIAKIVAALRVTSK